MEKKIITISREFGSGGRTVGHKVAERLGIPFYDKELVNQVALESGFAPKFVEEHGEHSPSSSLFSYAFAPQGVPGVMNGLSTADFLWNIQCSVILQLAEKGSCVIVGRCSDYVLRGLPEASHIFIYAEEKDKIKRAVQEYGIPEDEAQKLMRDTDKARANYYAYHTGRKWGEHVNYSLSIDSGYIEIEDIVDLIVQYTKVRRFSQA